MVLQLAVTFGSLHFKIILKLFAINLQIKFEIFLIC